MQPIHAKAKLFGLSVPFLDFGMICSIEKGSVEKSEEHLQYSQYPFARSKTTFLDTITQGFFPLYNPRISNWDEHFIWDESLTSMIGKTAIGRVTIAAIRLNRRQLKNLRRALIAIGEHPPN